MKLHVLLRHFRIGLSLGSLMLVLGGIDGLASAQVTPEPGSGSPRLITDMAGHAIAIPNRVDRVATVGPVPVINSFIFAVGRADAIVNGLPAALSKYAKFQRALAPQVGRQPAVQVSGGEPNIEALLALHPDVVLGMDGAVVDSMARKGVPAVFLAWRDSDDVKSVIKLLGDIFNRQDAAADYIRYFDATLKRVSHAVSDVPEAQRPKVLFCILKSLSQPHHIADWWIGQAGGISVTANGRPTENFPFSLEQMLQWNPDILIVSTPNEVEQVYQDARLGMIKAVRDRKVYAMPVGAHPWGNRTAEQPLTVLWAAKLFYPERLKDLDLEAEIKNFYSRFYRYRLSDDEVRKILSGLS